MFLTAIAFALLCLGSYLLSRQRYVWDAVLLVVIALGLLGGAAFRSRRRRRVVRDQIRRLWPQTTAGWMRGLALAISAGVALRIRSRPSGANFASLLVLWGGAVILFVGATLPISAKQLRGLGAIAWWRDRLGRRSQYRAELLWLGLLLVGAGLVRGVALGQVPYNLGGDEGTQLAHALTLVAAPLGNPFATGWYSVPMMSFLAYGMSMRIFGATIAGGRALSAVVGTLTVATTYLLGRALGGKRVGGLAAAMVAFSAYHLHFSRLASNQIFDPLIGTLALWLVVKGIWLGGRRRGDDDPLSVTGDDLEDGLRFRAVCFLGLAGVVAGCGWYAYFGARWVTFLIGGLFVIQSLTAPGFVRRYWRGMVFFGLGWLVVVLPLLGWYMAHPSALVERYHAVSIFASGWLRREIEITGRSALALMLQQLWRSATAFHLTPDPTFWYYPQKPLVDFVTGSLLLVGLLEAGRRLRWPSRWLTLFWYGATLVMAWGITENPPSSQRGLLLVPAVALLVSWGSLWLAQRLGAADGAFRWWAGGVIALVALLNCGFYFGVYTPRRTYGNPTAEMATAFARYTLAHPDPICPEDAASMVACQGKVYFLGPPVLYWDFGTLRFMLRYFPGQDVAAGSLPQAVVGPARFALVPERAADLSALQSSYPGGEVHEVRSPEGALLMIVYDWAG